MQKKHPDVLRLGRQIDMSDVLADPVVQFEERYDNITSCTYSRNFHVGANNRKGRAQ
jgi:hypothetical protein